MVVRKFRGLMQTLADAFPSLEILAITEEDSAYQIEAQAAPLIRCPSCDGDVRPWGYTRRYFHDLPQRGKAAMICVRRKRWRCSRCRATSPDVLPADQFVVRGNGNLLTRRLYNEVQRRCLAGCPNTVIAREIGLSESQIRRLRSDGKIPSLPRGSYRGPYAVIAVVSGNGG